MMQPTMRLSLQQPPPGRKRSVRILNHEHSRCKARLMQRVAGNEAETQLRLLFPRSLGSVSRRRRPGFTDLLARARVYPRGGLRRRGLVENGRQVKNDGKRKTGTGISSWRKKPGWSRLRLTVPRNATRC